MKATISGASSTTLHGRQLRTASICRQPCRAQRSCIRTAAPNAPSNSISTLSCLKSRSAKRSATKPRSTAMMLSRCSSIFEPSRPAPSSSSHPTRISTSPSASGRSPTRRSPDVFAIDRARRSAAAPPNGCRWGAQNKLLVVYRDGALFEPIGSEPSTHILEPNQVSDDYPATVINEYLVMRLAQTSDCHFHPSSDATR